MGKYFSKVEKERLEEDYTRILGEFVLEHFLIDIEDYDLEVKLNARLRRSMGRYRYSGANPVDIELNTSFVKYNDRELVLDTLYHEAVHFALHVSGEPFDDSDVNFNNVCNNLGVGLSGEHGFNREVHVYKCPKCELDYHVDRKIRKGRYICAECTTKQFLTYEGKTISDASYTG